MRVNGSIDSMVMCGSSLWLPEIVGGAISTCSVRPDVSMHQHALLWGPPMTPGSLAACWQSHNSICNGSTGANWNAVWAFKSTCINNSIVTVHLQ